MAYTEQQSGQRQRQCGVVSDHYYTYICGVYCAGRTVSAKSMATIKRHTKNVYPQNTYNKKCNNNRNNFKYAPATTRKQR